MINFLDVIFPGEYPVEEPTTNITTYTIIGISVAVLLVVFNMKHKSTLKWHPTGKTACFPSVVKRK